MKPERADKYQIKLGLSIACVFAAFGIFTAVVATGWVPLSVVALIFLARVVYTLAIWCMYVHVAPQFKNKLLALTVFIVFSMLAILPLVPFNVWVNEVTGFFYPPFEDPKTIANPYDHIFWSYTWRAFPSGLFIFLIRYREDLIFERQFYLLAHEKTKNENLMHQLDTLKQQLDPHFLFNTLNGLKTLIRTDPIKAEQYAIEVSGVYRYLLRHNRSTTVTLEEELKFLEAYTSLLQLRFEDNFKMVMKIDPALKKRMIFPMSLQLLVENAVKHNVVTSSQPLVIEIFTEGNQIVVQNAVKLRSSTDGISQYGLSNLNSLYNLHYQQDIEISQTNGIFKVSLPIL